MRDSRDSAPKHVSHGNCLCEAGHAPDPVSVRYFLCVLSLVVLHDTMRDSQLRETAAAGMSVAETLDCDYGHKRISDRVMRGIHNCLGGRWHV